MSIGVFSSLNFNNFQTSSVSAGFAVPAFQALFNYFLDSTPQTTHNSTISSFNTNAQGDVINLYEENIGSFKIHSNSAPNISTTSDKEKPFRLDSPVVFTVEYIDKDKNKHIYTIPIKKGYQWDGASIPDTLQGIVGKKDEKEFVIASLVHDVLCENHSLVDGNRALSSSIFRELLIANGVNSYKATVMAYAVDQYQYFTADWENSYQNYA